MGLGVVGTGVFRALTQRADLLAAQVGAPLVLKGILVRDASKDRAVEVHGASLTTSSEELLRDPSIQIIVEVMGAEEPAHAYIQRAINLGKHVVTANKEVMAKHGPELLALAESKGVCLGFEGSVGGGIPIIALARKDLVANRIGAIHAIINGTTNYILTQMAEQGWDLDYAVQKAQELGFAEPDPSYDVDGLDAAYKLATLSTLAFRSPVRVQDVYYEGIRRLRARDFKYAQELGYSIKLLAIGKIENGSLQVRVHPAMIPQDLLLAKVTGVFNAIQVDGDLVGRLLLYGRGAGAEPTTSAIMADVIDIARGIVEETGSLPSVRLETGRSLSSINALITRYYLRIDVADRPGVLAQIAKVLGDMDISIASVIQKETNSQAQTAEIVIMTHESREASVQKALKGLKELSVVKDIGNFLRVEDCATPKEGSR